jgi:hypothetical protein
LVRVTPIRLREFSPILTFALNSVKLICEQ